MGNKILVISPSPTHPPYGGNRECIYSYTQMLKGNGYDVYFLWIANFNHTVEEYEKMQKFWGDRLFVFRKNGFHHLTEAIFRHVFFRFTGYFPLDAFYPWGIQYIIGKIKSKHVFGSVIINYVFLTKIFKHFKSERKILYTHDVFSNKYQLTGSKWFSVYPNAEQRALNRADRILSIQEHESIYFSFLTPKRIYTSYSFSPVYDTPYIDNKIILYLAGANSYNVESILWYIENVHQQLIELDSEIELLIGGAICIKLQEYKTRKGIRLLGFIDNKLEFYKMGNIVINPTFNGTGLKIKSIEALAFGKVLITHPHGIRGVYECEYKPFNLASNAKEYVDTIKQLINLKDQIKVYKKHSIDYVESLNKDVMKTFKKAISE